MSTETVSVNNGGIGFAGLLTVLFIGLKLTHYIDWSWLWVLAPLWLPVGVVVALLAFGLFAALVVKLVTWR